MCAIFGSFNTSMFEVLYEANKQRGNFASSIISLTEDDQYIKKKKGDIDFDKYTHQPDTFYYAGHVQAPTSAVRVWNYDTSHPFETMTWMVSHNGVLTNHKKLNKIYSLYCSVDTDTIVNLLEFFTQAEHKKNKLTINTKKIVKDTLECLSGTFALSIVCCSTNEVFIARSGSILHYNNNGDYSTLGGDGLKELPEGVIMKLNMKTHRWNKLCTFKHDSPFSFI
jgi:glucosamine 6-phosphate synthetase-like amidotransferase/phosphosugar isomerase protein